MPPVAATSQAVVRAARVRQAFRLEFLTLAWMTIKAAVGIGTGWPRSAWCSSPSAPTA